MKRTIVLLLVGISLGLALPVVVSLNGTHEIIIESNNTGNLQSTVPEVSSNKLPEEVELVRDEETPMGGFTGMDIGDRMAVMFTPPAYPFELTQAAYAPWYDNWDSQCDLVFFDGDSTDGPATELGRKTVAATQESAWNWFDVSDLGIVIESGSFFFAVEYIVDNSPALYLDAAPPLHHVSWMYTIFSGETEPMWAPFDNINAGPGLDPLGDTLDLMLRVKGLIPDQVPPDADFTADPRSGPAPLTVSFTDLSTGDPTEWEWDFGDTRTSTTQNPIHVYDNEGTYTVSLTVRNANGEDTEVKTNYITVGVTPPSADFSGTPRSGPAPLSVVFTDLSTGDPTSWSWSFGDGGTSASQNPTHIYNNEGTYTVSLTATNAYGSDTETKTDYITVSSAPQPPDADFSADPTSGPAPLTVNFTDLSTGAPTSWSWNFGDGGSSTDQNPQHTYNTAGTYTVSLTATNADGSDTETKPGYITVTEVLQAAFTASPSMGYVPLTHRMEVQFTDQSAGNPTAWSWDFGDNGTSTEQNPTHVYTSAGDFVVTLDVSNADGSDNTTDTVHLYVLPGDFFTQTAALASIAQNGIKIGYGTPVATNIELLVYDTNGRLIKRLFSDEIPAGEYEALWDLRDENGIPVRPGVYFVRLKASQGHASSKIIVTH